MIYLVYPDNTPFLIRQVAFALNDFADIIPPLVGHIRARTSLNIELNQTYDAVILYHDLD
jgi:hypothetical protein